MADMIAGAGHDSLDAELMKYQVEMTQRWTALADKLEKGGNDESKLDEVMNDFLEERWTALADELEKGGYDASKLDEVKNALRHQSQSHLLSKTPPGEQHNRRKGGYDPVSQDSHAVGAHSGRSLKQPIACIYLVVVLPSASIALLAFMSSVAFYCSGQSANCLVSLCIMCFGCGFGVLVHYGSCKCLHVVSRITGNGAMIFFLGCTLFANCWHSELNFFLLFMTGVVCVVVCHVGVIVIMIGIAKSNKLERAQRLLKQQLDEAYVACAKTSPGQNGFLTPQEFNLMTSEYASERFEEWDLKGIFDALIPNPSWPEGVQGPVMTYQDLQKWVNGGKYWL